jgi:hypothetical protein
VLSETDRWILSRASETIQGLEEQQKSQRLWRQKLERWDEIMENVKFAIGRHLGWLRVYYNTKYNPKKVGRCGFGLNAQFWGLWRFWDL